MRKLENLKEWVAQLEPGLETKRDKNQSPGQENSLSIQN